MSHFENRSTGAKMCCTGINSNLTPCGLGGFIVGLAGSVRLQSIY